MSASTLPLPSWAETVLQGLAYWVGYQRNRYFGHHLTEGAIAAEAAALIAGRIGHRRGDDRAGVQREVPFKELVVGTNRTSGQQRMDLWVRAPFADGLAVPEVSVVEVKLATASTAQIDNDLRRLADVLRDSKDPALRAFLLIVGEQAIPKRFVQTTRLDDGWRLRAKPSVSQPHGMDGYRAMTRRVCISSSSLRKSGNTHLACLVEVINVSSKSKSEERR
jgi:hypothetical protein